MTILFSIANFYRPSTIHCLKGLKLCSRFTNAINAIGADVGNKESDLRLLYLKVDELSQRDARKFKEVGEWRRELNGKMWTKLEWNVKQEIEEIRAQLWDEDMECNGQAGGWDWKTTGVRKWEDDLEV